MRKRTNKTLTAAWGMTWALLAPGLAAAAPVVRIAGPDTLQLINPAGQPQASWTVESTIQDVLQIDSTLYVACGPRGVLIYDLSAAEKPALLGRLAEGRNVVKLAQNGKSLLVVVADFSALTFSLADPQRPLPAPLGPPSGGGLAPLDSAPPSRSPAGAAYLSARPPVILSPSLRAPAASWAQVTAVRGGWVAVTTRGPVQVGDRFIVHSQRRVPVSDPTLSQKLYAPSNQATGMFLVNRKSGNLASGPLPRGTVAHVGDLAEPTPEPMFAPLVAPPLWYGMGRFYGTLRPVLGITNSGNPAAAAPFALLNDFTLEYYFRVPLKLGVQVAPLGLAIGSATGLTTEVRALISFASSYFELGLEPGGELHRVGQSQLLLGYMLRLGSLDGLNLVFHNSYVLNTRAVATALSLASLSAEVNIPLASRFNLYLSGGSGNLWAYGTVGLKYYARGGGGPGTLIVSAGAGGAWVSDRCEVNANSTNAYYCQSTAVETVGPAMSLGLDARF